MTDVLIIGGGTAGMAAAIYSLRSGLSVKVFEKGVIGGQIATTPDIENFPSISNISGFDFSQNLMEQARSLGAEFIMENVESVDVKDKIKKVKTYSGVHEGKSLIIANGVQRRKLLCKGEEEFNGKGVSYCATCDGAFFKGKNVAIVGGGNTALEDALFLSQNCKKVYLIHRKDTFRADEILIQSVHQKENIEILMNSTISEIKGDNLVNAVIVKDEVSAQSIEIEVNGIFIAIGLAPDNELFKDIVDIDENGYIKADESCLTKTEGVFVAGDSRTKILRQLITAAADGATAAFQSANYINTL